jgi:vacuolar-type H+-ATPase subunit H
MDNIIMDQRIGPTTIDKILSDAYERQMEIILLGTQEAEALQRKLVSAERAKIDEYLVC